MVSVTASKNNLVHEMFVRTADENYITARWCAINELNTDFLWLAVHALEKYLKAVLLVNGNSAKKYSHNIVKLFADVKVMAGTLFPDRLPQPADLQTAHWFERSAEDFIAHLFENGNADNRYLIYGFAKRSEDIHMLDAMVFAIRRLICSLDAPYLLSKRPDAPTFTNRDVLTRQPQHYNRLAMPLDQLIWSKRDSELRKAALNLNAAFAPIDFIHEPMRHGYAARNPVIVRRILQPLTSDDPKSASAGIEIARWFIGNVQIPKGSKTDPGVFEQIQAAIDAARLKHGIT